MRLCGITATVILTRPCKMQKQTETKSLGKDTGIKVINLSTQIFFIMPYKKEAITLLEYKALNADLSKHWKKVV